MLLIWFIVCLTLVDAKDVDNRLEVICPDLPFHSDSQGDRKFPSFASTNDDFCQCSLGAGETVKTAIIKCDFNYEKNIILKDTLFPFRKMNITSAYVRMKNAKSAIISSEFLSSWMDSPSSALDLWYCGRVVIEPTPHLLPTQRFPELKTFVGVGIISCQLDSLPSFFLRDRSRSGFRLKGCSVKRINTGLFHNIEEVRYMNFEDTVVGEIAGPLSSSGVITLSKKEFHSWDGIVFLNSTFVDIAPCSFNVTHKEEMEKFVVKQSRFGKVGTEGIAVTGDIDVTFTNSSFFQLDSFALQVSVSGKIAFSNNVIETFVPDSLLGLTCKNESMLSGNTFFVQSTQHDHNSMFMKECSAQNVHYVVKTKSAASHGLPPGTSSAIAIIVLIVLLLAAGMLVWSWKNRSIFKYHYRRNDVPLLRS